MLNFLLSAAETQQMGWIIGWGIFLILTIVVEVYTVQIVSIWFTLGALVALVLAIFNVPYWAQLLVFAIVSIISLIVGRLFLKKFLKRSKSEPSNVDRYIGQVIVIKTPVKKLKPGSGVLGDITWTVAVHADVEFEVGDHCVIDAIEGNKIIVSRKDQ